MQSISRRIDSQKQYVFIKKILNPNACIPQSRIKQAPFTENNDWDAYGSYFHFLFLQLKQERKHKKQIPRYIG